MAVDKTMKPVELTTLTQVHEVLVRIRPKRDAPLEQWRSYYERSAALYSEIAEIDRGHHHEALYWAQREKEKAQEITTDISSGSAHSPKVKRR